MRRDVFEIEKTFRFEAAHTLVDHDGKCARPHGHSWVFRLLAHGHYLQASGPQRNMLVDFGDISKVGKRIVGLCDHRDLNSVFVEAKGMVTSEWLARHFYNLSQTWYPGLIYGVEIEETCTSKCRYVADAFVPADGLHNQVNR